MVKEFLTNLLRGGEAEYATRRTRLLLAGLSEHKLRQMAPDARVEALEKAHLDPYDYIFLAC